MEQQQEEKQIELEQCKKRLTEAATIKYQAALSQAISKESCATIASISKEWHDIISGLPSGFQYVYTVPQPSVPRSAQELFGIDRKNAQKSDSVQGKSWTQLTNEEKEPYEKRAREAKIQYDKDLQSHMDSKTKKCLASSELNSEMLRHLSDVRTKLNHVENNVSRCLLQAIDLTGKPSTTMEKPTVSASRKRPRTVPSRGTGTTNNTVSSKSTPSPALAQRQKEEVLESGELPKAPKGKRSRAPPSSDGKKKSGGPGKFNCFRREWMKENPGVDSRGANEKWHTMSQAEKNQWWTNYIESGQDLKAPAKPKSKKARTTPTPNTSAPIPGTSFVHSIGLPPLSQPLSNSSLLATPVPVPVSTPTSTSMSPPSTSTATSTPSAPGAPSGPIAKPANLPPLTFNTLAAASLDKVSSARSNSSEYSAEDGDDGNGDRDFEMDNLFEEDE